MAAFFMLFSHAEFISASYLYQMSITSCMYCVYIITNKSKGVLYIGVTGDLNRRMSQHHDRQGGEFASRYNLKRLVYFEEFTSIDDAIKREKQLKNWHRQWKINLIEEMNPDWNDLMDPKDSETSSE